MGRLVLECFVLGRFVLGRFVLGHFVFGRFVCASFISMCTLKNNFLSLKNYRFSV